MMRMQALLEVEAAKRKERAERLEKAHTETKSYKRGRMCQETLLSEEFRHMLLDEAQ